MPDRGEEEWGNEDRARWRRREGLFAASLSASARALEAANPSYETRIFGPDRVRVQGRLVGLIRRY